MTTNIRAQMQHTILEPETPHIALVLNEKEEEDMRRMLHKERDHLTQLNQEIHRLESVLAGLYEERKTCTGHVDNYSFSLAPHRRLPSELLARIFLELQRGQTVILPPNPNESPWVLQRVCARWRQVVGAEGRLWSELEVEDQPFEGADEGSYAEDPPKISRAEHVAINWIPRLWSQTQSFPVSLSLSESSAQSGIAIREVLAPYYHRMQSLSLYTPLYSFPSIFVGHSYSFDALESLVLNTGHREYRKTHFFPTKDQPVTIFTTSTKLRKATFKGHSSMDTVLPNIYHLPWSQLTQLTFFLIRIFPEELEAILKECNNLISLTFTSTSPDTYPDDKNKMEILLPHLESIAVIMEDGNSYHKIFSVLQVPLLKELSFGGSVETGRIYTFDHTQLISMIKRSRSNINSLSFHGYMEQWTPESLLEQLPNLARLVVPQSRPMPGSIFDMAVEGKILQGLKYLECFTDSPVPFLKLLDHQCTFPPSSENHGITTANVSYDTYLTEEQLNTVRELYETLQPKFKSCGKDIMLKGLSFGTPEYWE